MGLVEIRQDLINDASGQRVAARILEKALTKTLGAQSHFTN